MGSDGRSRKWRPLHPLFQSTLPGWGATDSVEISDGGVVISIHAPRMGSDYPITITPLGISAFQSTLPGWGATRRHNHGGQTRGDFNPRSPDGERHGAGRTARDTGIISIHAPRMGSDERCPCRTRHPATFQSTLPGWGATRHRKTQAALAKISIHAPRMGSDAHHRVAIVGQEVISICVCSIESGPCERVESLQMSGRF